ncbi:Protein kinase-like domain protein, partial [Metarhizium majus ARSEF 297]
MAYPNPGDIRTLATEITGSPCTFIHNTEFAPLAGGEYIVYALASSSGFHISIRIPKEPTNLHTSILLNREAEFRRRINTAKLSLFQPLLAFSDAMNNSLRFPFLALGWVDGSPLRWSDTIPATDIERRRILHCIANASLDLLHVSQESKQTALEWIQSKISRKIIRAQEGSLPGGSVAECQKQMELTTNYWVPELDTAPHVLIHGDLSGNNIIIDKNDHNVQGIIDLGWAELVPLQFAAVYPRFLTHEPLEGQENGWTGRDSEQMELDRAFYLECIQERAIQAQGEGLNMLMDYYRVLSREDEIERYFWLTAASRIDIHRAMAKCDWKPPIRRSK